MSDRPHSGITPQPHAGPAPRAVATAPLVTGMVSPSTPFVDGNGNLTPVGFRFLHDLLSRVSSLEARLAAANIP